MGDQQGFGNDGHYVDNMVVSLNLTLLDLACEKATGGLYSTVNLVLGGDPA